MNINIDILRKGLLSNCILIANVLLFANYVYLYLLKYIGTFNNISNLKIYIYFSIELKI